MKSYGGSKVTVLLILKATTRWMGMVKLTPTPCLSMTFESGPFGSTHFVGT